MSVELNYDFLSRRLEFTKDEIRTAVAHLITHDFAQIVHGFYMLEGDVLLLMTPRRLAEQERKKAKAVA